MSVRVKRAVKRLNCLVCNSEKITTKYRGISDLEYSTYTPVDYSMCDECGFLIQEPMPSPDVVETFYPNEYRNYLPISKGLFSFLKKKQFQDLAKKISSKASKDGHVLEIGFGNGELLKALGGLGFTNLYGVDFVSSNKPDLSSCGIKVSYQNAEKGIPFDPTFDLIIMNNVIEHFLKPEDVLKNCFNKLKSNGTLILLTPNGNALEASLFGKHWAGFHAPRHTVVFNSQNIEILGKRIGFSSFKMSPVADPGQWSISIQNTLQENKLTRTKLKNGMAWYLLPLSIAVTPIVFMQNVLGKSTSMMCILKK